MKAREIRKLERARQHKEMKAYCKKIDRAFSRLSEGCSERVSRAISLAGTRQKEVEVTAVKKNRIYYRDVNSLGNKIHAVQRMKLSSKPLI
ncbi:TPA_asm: transcriptional regulator [Salmonella enterica subsp. enterica serovar Mbandaka]|uniref:Transcriptional regulator n=1 Tax=Salmonella enterica subsp. enterica serovar Mbandaka TaxID=192954 RepID=A0A6Y3V1J8_SALET|nr:transcriptional regulator [Salmonella enterica subsp. enterica serovar Mbandaka]HAB2032033.1 transcriptional regulator [Salmonella enterica subsp. enterica serovar Mbandaka]HAB4979450.1 transcriptional regulator [Salmonella enterica subsp. enterica serovar Mbandaka]HAB5338363.1 transcriptional regulator [Salmonella enterica subsp. enterica serovar Mbandaka]